MTAALAISHLGAIPANVFPPPPAGTAWRMVPATSVPAGVVFQAPVYVGQDATNLYARAIVPQANGGAWLLVRAFPRAGNFRTRVDAFYYADPPKQAASARYLAGPPADGAGWQAWSGELPQPVAVAFATRGRAGQDFRAEIGGRHWLVRSDMRGAATATLGSAPLERRLRVSAWQATGAAAAPRPRLALRPVAYLGEPAAPWPPAPEGWAETVPDEETRRELVPSLLGELPLSHYADAMTSTGLYRFFAYQTGAGQKAIGALRFWGTLGATLGDPSALGDTTSDLANFNAQVANGDAALAASNWSAAVVAYQAAGQIGATSLGPDIDAQTGGVSQPTTQQAWGLNTNLATIPADASATQADAQNAQGLAQQMNALYQQAIAMTPPAPTPGAAPSQGSTSANVTAAGNAASALVSYFQTHACSQASIPTVLAFQQAYNASGLGPQVTADGQYGPLSQAAVQVVLDFTHGGAGQGGQAPANCFTGTAAPAPGLDTPTPGGAVTPTTKPTATVTPTSAPVVAQAGMSSGSKVALALGAVAVVGALGWAAATGNLPAFTQAPS